MSIIPFQNKTYTLPKGEIIFVEGQNAQSVNILLKGKVNVFISALEDCTEANENDVFKKSFRIFSKDQNIFLGTHDLFSSGKYTLSYRAAEDSSVYTFVARDLEQVQSLMNIHKDYGAHFITTICGMIDSSYISLCKLERLYKSLMLMADNLTVYFWKLNEEAYSNFSPAYKYFRDGLEKFQKMKDEAFSFPIAFDTSFFEEDYSYIWETEYSSITEIDQTKIDYYKRLPSLPSELLKSFYSADVWFSSYQCRDAAKLLDEILLGIKETFKAVEECLEMLYSKNGDCIFSDYLRASNEMKKNKTESSPFLQALAFIADKIKEVVSLYEDEYFYDCGIDIGHLDSLLSMAKTSCSSSFTGNASLEGEALEIVQGPASFPEELRNSAARILEYSNIPKDRAEIFMTNLEAFRALNDKFKVDAETNSIRSAISSTFFEIYEAVFKRVISENNESRLFDMFINFGFMDEKLLSTDNAVLLYKLAGSKQADGQSNVYTMKEWLLKIFNMEKDPSINDFGQNYFDIFREQKKRHQVTEKDRVRYENDVNGRLNYEIFNMLKTNQKLCHGQISIYFPILHDEIISKDLSKALVTSDIINNSLNKILDVDFSAFHREIFYNNPEKGIEKELIMKSYLPEIILMPVFGTRAIMWQELDGRNRSTPGRFIFPAFTSDKIDDLMLKTVGNFRWELCRTMMGVAWNDISEKSLTSEYTDYIQFYRKNKELTETAKGKVKAQIQKHRNMMRDIFTSDYEAWVNYEANGIRRLNKVVREVLYKYCPFSKPIREGLEKQPMYSDVAAHFNNVRAKQAKKLKGHYSMLTKNGSLLDLELEENLIFYRDM